MVRKNGLILTLCLILFLTFAAVVQAVPPAQGEDGASVSDSLNLDDEGNPLDETDESPDRQNLGTIMSGRGAGDDDEECVDDGTGNCEEENTEDDIEECVDDGTGNCEEEDIVDSTGRHPVASALADYFEVSYDEVMGLHEDGYGFGVITKAYFFADELGKTPEELLQAAHGTGWGNILRESGLQPGNGGQKDKDKSANFKKSENNEASDLAGPGGGRGKDKNKDKDNDNNGRSGQNNGNGRSGDNNGNGGGNGKGGGKK